MHDWLGSDWHPVSPGCTKEVRTKTSVRTSESGGVRRTVFETRFGSTELVEKFDAPSQAWYPVECPIENLDDVKLMTERCRCSFFVSTS